VNFYNDLLALKLPVKDILENDALFKKFPSNWHVIVADIADSTDAVKAGRHSDVNLVAAGSLVAALNVSKAFNLEIPFFWGGDGGTVIVPKELLENTLTALNAHRLNSLKNFSLTLRYGSVSITEIIDAGHEIKIAKVAIGSGFNKSIVIGDGLKYAEQKIKAAYKENKIQTKKELEIFDSSTLNLEGLECRWDTIKPPPPTAGREVVCLLIEAVDPKNQLSVYNNALKILEEIYGAVEKRHPLSVKGLRLINSFKKFQNEMLARYSKWKPFYLLKLFFQTIIGKVYFKFNLSVNNLKGQDYLAQVIEFSDTLTIDGRINTIVSGTPENRKLFLAYLSKEEEKGILLYGHHVSAESMMTCYIENLQNKHIHFVDGVNGGYTEAAKELKPKFRKD